MSTVEVDAELARSILACPESAELAVDGHPTVGCDDDLGLRDEDGVPTFSCRAASLLAEAGREGSRALVTLVSGLGPRGGPDRSLTLTLTGRLGLGPRESCTCCGEERHDVPLAPRLRGAQPRWRRASAGCRSRRSAPPRSSSTAATSNARSSTPTTAIARTSARSSCARPARRPSSCSTPGSPT